MALAYIGLQRERQEIRRRLARPRVMINRPLIRVRALPMVMYNDREMVKRYRFPSRTVSEFIELARPALERPTERGLSVEIQVLSALCYFAHGASFTLIGDVHGISRFSTARSVFGFADVLCAVAPQHIKFPLDRQSLLKIMVGLHDIAGMPCAVGLIDGSLVPIEGNSVADDEHVYVCRKGYHAINVQGVCDHEKTFTNIVAKWPGSTGDSIIFADSSLCTHFMNGDLTRCWLLGDAGYACMPHLMTPLAETPDTVLTDNERRYNRSHKTTRSLIERTFGLWKNRFMCMHKGGGQMLLAPEKCCKVILATAVLHNIAVKMNLPILNIQGAPIDIEIEDEDDEGPVEITLEGQDLLNHREGIQVRRELINHSFGHNVQ